jgi:peptidoglycan/LPS O-acetylase OafA/YrhL
MLGHVQFLRAISVLSVFFYHLNFNLFKSGYLGVDIFFVISGYVISRKIYEDYKKKGRIDFATFYVQRFKRIFPLLFFFLLIIYFLIVFFTPTQFSLGIYFYEIATALIGVSNLYFLHRGAEYFDSEIDSPLIHTWSLGVEEQFYFFFPIIIYCCFKIFKLSKIKYVLCILILISFSFPIFLNLSHKEIFFFSAFRFWELLIGVLCFFLTLNYLPKKNKYFFILPLLFLIIILNLDIQNSNRLLNVIIVILTGLFIYFYYNYKFLVKVINNKYLIDLGNISFSFYLWHLPVIFFLNFYFNINLIFFLIISFSITLIISKFSHIYIENYFRRRSYVKKDILFLCIPLLTAFFFIISSSKLDSYWGTHGKERYLLINSFNYLNKKYNVHERFFFFSHNINDNLVYKYCQNNINRSNFYVHILLKPECIKNNSIDHLFYLEGNSSMIQYINLINSSDIIKNYYFKYVSKQEYSYSELNYVRNFYNNVTYVRTINSLDELKSFKQNLNKFNKEVNFLIFGPAPFANKDNTIECLVKNNSCSFNTDRDKLKRETDFIYKELLDIKNNTNSKVQFINVYSEICPRRICDIYDVNSDILIFRDKTHFSKEGAKKLLKNINSIVF